MNVFYCVGRQMDLSSKVHAGVLELTDEGITITTVGYSDHGISPSGQKFATLLLVGGIGVASYSFAVLVQGLVANTFVQDPSKDE